MEIKFKPIGGATWIMQIDDLKFACDPVLCEQGSVQDFFWFKSTRIEEAKFEKQDFKNIDFWLLTHNHEDHLDKEGLNVINKESKLIIHKNLKKKLINYNIKILNHNQKTKLNIKDFVITIEAIPAVHGIIPISALAAGGVNGYWLTIIKNNKKLEIYVSGDTVYKQKVAKALFNRKADIFIPNVGGASKGTIFGTLTMTVQMLKKFVKIIKPKIILPVHYGTFSHYNEPISETVKLNNKNIYIIKRGETFNSKIYFFYSLMSEYSFI